MTTPLPGVQFFQMFKHPEHMDMTEHRNQDAPAFIERAVSHLAALGMRVGWSGHADEYGQAVSGTLTIHNGGRPHKFSAIASPSNTKPDVAMFPHDRDTVLISEKVTQSRAQQLKDRGWGGYVDSSGNASPRGEGLVIEIAGQRNGDSAQQAATTAPFTRAGLPVTFSLLAANEHFGSTPTQRALADTSGASLGTVNRVIRALRERTPSFLEGKHNELLKRSTLDAGCAVRLGNRRRPPRRTDSASIRAHSPRRQRQRPARADPTGEAPQRRARDDPNPACYLDKLSSPGLQRDRTSAPYSCRPAPRRRPSNR